MITFIEKLSEAVERLSKRVFFPLRGKAPFSTRVLRGAGHGPQSQMTERIALLFFGFGILFGFLVGLIVAWLAVITGTFGGTLQFIILIILAVLIVLGRRQFSKIRNAQIGYYGELKVGEMLEHLGRRNWFVFHSLDMKEFGWKGGDIDHVIVCPKGVFCVETKAFRPSPNERSNKLTHTPGKPHGILHYSLSGSELLSNPLQKLQEKAMILHNHLPESCGNLDYVGRILALPEWEIEYKDSDGRELVFSRLEEIRRFLQEGEDKLQPEQIKTIKDFLDDKLRQSLEEFH